MPPGPQALMMKMKTADGIAAGQKEAPSKEGKEMTLSPEQAGWRRRF